MSLYAFSISAYKDHYGLQNVKEPFPLDVTSPVESWNAGSQACSLDAVVNMNMIHISPWDTAIVSLFIKDRSLVARCESI